MKDSVLMISLIGALMMLIGFVDPGPGGPGLVFFLGLLGVAFGATWAIAGAAARDQQ